MKSSRYLAKENYVNEQSVEWWSRHLNHLVLQETKNLINGKVLDIGCGCGAMSILAARMGNDVTGLDLNPEAIDKAQQHRLNESEEIRARLEFVTGPCNYLPFTDDFFDSAFMIDVLEHIYPEDRGAIFNEIARVLKPKANMIIIVPHGHHYPDEAHVAFFADENELDEILREANLRVKDIWLDERLDGTTTMLHHRLNALVQIIE